MTSAGEGAYAESWAHALLKVLMASSLQEVNQELVITRQLEAAPDVLH